MIKTTKHYIECACSSAEHLATIYFDVENCDQSPFIYLQLQLPKTSFFQRILNAFKYILGYQSKYGHWDEVVLNAVEAKRLKNLLEDFEKCCDTLSTKISKSELDKEI